MVKCCLLLVAALAAAATSPAMAQCGDILPSGGDLSPPDRGITAFDLVGLRDFGSNAYAYLPSISPYAVSPDGRSIAFVITRADPARNDYCRALVVMPANGGMPRIVDRGGEYIMLRDVQRGLIGSIGGGAIVTPAWSSDGHWLAYRKRVGDVTQVWRVRTDGTGATAATHSPTDVERFAWAANGAIVYATRIDEVAANRAIDEEARSGWLYDDRVVTMESLRPAVRATDALETSFVTSDTGRDRPATDQERRLLPPDTLGGDPAAAIVTSRDGRRAGIDGISPAPFSPRRLWVEQAGTRTYCSFAACRDGILQTWWSDDGALIFQRREGYAGSEMAFYRWRPGKGPPRRILGPGGWESGCTYKALRLFCTAESSTRPAHLIAIDVRTGGSRTLFDPNPGFARLRLGRVERLYTRNDMGLASWADLVVPPDYRPGQRVPLIVVQYRSRGFLRGGTGDDYPIFLLAARGFAVLSFEAPPSYGSNRPDLDTWDKLITAMSENWADRRSVLSSLLAAVDQAVARGVADPERIGITGLSDGASTVEFALLNTHRFSAAAVSSCCEDPQSVMTYGGTAWADWNHAVRKYPLASEDGAAFWKPVSIALNAQRLDTPLLMQLADHETLIALQAFTALRDHDKPVELYVFPDEWHMKWQPQHRLAVYQRSVDWFSFWLLGREDSDPGKRLQYDRWERMRSLRDSRLAPATPAKG